MRSSRTRKELPSESSGTASSSGATLVASAGAPLAASRSRTVFRYSRVDNLSNGVTPGAASASHFTVTPPGFVPGGTAPGPGGTEAGSPVLAAPGSAPVPGAFGAPLPPARPAPPISPVQATAIPNRTAATPPARVSRPLPLYARANGFSAPPKQYRDGAPRAQARSAPPADRKS